MKPNILNNRISGWKNLLLLFLTTAAIQSCRNNDDEVQNPDKKVLISYERVSSLPIQNIQAGFSLISLVFPEINKLNFSNISDVDIYKVKYRTTLNNKEIAASGMVCVPKSNGSYPVLSFQNGTNTSNKNAPTQNMSGEQFAILQNLSGLGYIVTISDYVGFGESNNILHPYYHRESSDAAVINLIKAAGELLNERTSGARSNGKLFMMGYSQGGWATLSAFKTLETDNTTGLEPIAASCGAGAYNLSEIAKHILNLPYYGSPVYLPYFIESHQRNGFLNTSLDLYFNKPYSDTIPKLFNGDRYLGTINSALNDTISRLMTQDIIQNFATSQKFEPLRNELAQNSVDPWPVKGKLLFVHGKKDPVVPVFESENIVKQFRNLGINESQVSLQLLDGADHGSGITPWAIKSLVWIDSLK